jgi:hypothetical protein
LPTGFLTSTGHPLDGLKALARSYHVTPWIIESKHVGATAAEKVRCELATLIHRTALTAWTFQENILAKHICNINRTSYAYAVAHRDGVPVYETGNSSSGEAGFELRLKDDGGVEAYEVSQTQPVHDFIWLVQELLSLPEQDQDRALDAINVAVADRCSESTSQAIAQLMELCNHLGEDGPMREDLLPTALELLAFMFSCRVICKVPSGPDIVIKEDEAHIGTITIEVSPDGNFVLLDRSEGVESSADGSDEEQSEDGFGVDGVDGVDAYPRSLPTLLETVDMAALRSTHDRLKGAAFWQVFLEAGEKLCDQTEDGERLVHVLREKDDVLAAKEMIAAVYFPDLESGRFPDRPWPLNFSTIHKFRRDVLPTLLELLDQISGAHPKLRCRRKLLQLMYGAMQSGKTAMVIHEANFLLMIGYPSTVTLMSALPKETPQDQLVGRQNLLRGRLSIHLPEWLPASSDLVTTMSSLLARLPWLAASGAAPAADLWEGLSVRAMCPVLLLDTNGHGLRQLRHIYQQTERVCRHMKGLPRFPPWLGLDEGDKVANPRAWARAQKALRRIRNQRFRQFLRETTLGAFTPGLAATDGMRLDNSLATRLDSLNQRHGALVTAVTATPTGYALEQPDWFTELQAGPEYWKWNDHRIKTLSQFEGEDVDYFPALFAKWEDHHKKTLVAMVDALVEGVDNAEGRGRFILVDVVTLRAEQDRVAEFLRDYYGKRIYTLMNNGDPALQQGGGPGEQTGKLTDLQSHVARVIGVEDRDNVVWRSTFVVGMGHHLFDRAYTSELRDEERDVTTKSSGAVIASSGNLPCASQAQKFGRLLGNIGTSLEEITIYITPRAKASVVLYHLFMDQILGLFREFFSRPGE